MMKRIVNKLAIVLLGFVCLLPASALAADIEIREVMYNLDGTDADREWIEIRNISGSDIDLADWHFRENGTDHRLSASSEGGNTVLASGGYAVIADDPTSFKTDHPSFSALLLDSSFSLSNDGETLAITDPEEAPVTSLTYDPADGGDGDGLSLQRNRGGWLAAEPTPGMVNATTDSSDDADETDDEDDEKLQIMEPRQQQVSASSEEMDVDAGSDISAVAGVKHRFVGEIEGVEEGWSNNFDTHWSFGNGALKEGADVFYAYPHAGEYVATFSAERDAEVYTDSITVDVADPSIRISEVRAGSDGYVALSNEVGRQVDLSGWHLRAGGATFTLPENTIHLRGEVLRIPHTVSGLSGSSAELLFPNGEIATTSQPEKQSQANTANSYRTYSPPPTKSVDAAKDTSIDLSSSTATSVSLSGAFSTSSQPAAAGSINTGAFWQWAGMLILLVVSSIGVVIVLARFSKPADDPHVQAARFDIHEI